MSLKSKLRAALSVVFILTTAAAISVSAQTQTATGSYPTDATVRADSTNEPRKAEATKSSVVSAENPALPDKTADVNVEKDSVTRGASAPSTTTEARSETGSLPRTQPTSDDKWHFVFSPYFWMAGLHGTTGSPNRPIQVDESFGDIFHSLKFAFMSEFAKPRPASTNFIAPGTFVGSAMPSTVLRDLLTFSALGSLVPRSKASGFLSNVMCFMPIDVSPALSTPGVNFARGSFASEPVMRVLFSSSRRLRFACTGTTTPIRHCHLTSPGARIRPMAR